MCDPLSNGDGHDLGQRSNGGRHATAGRGDTVGAGSCQGVPVGQLHPRG